MVARDYEAPQDTGTNNVYAVTVKATDADGNAAEVSFTVTVQDVVEVATFTITGISNDGGRTRTRPFTGPTPSLSGDTPIGAVEWTLAGADAGDFTIVPTTGVVSMVARDYEDPQDTGTNNVYAVTVKATDTDGNDGRRVVHGDGAGRGGGGELHHRPGPFATRRWPRTRCSPVGDAGDCRGTTPIGAL